MMKNKEESVIKSAASTAWHIARHRSTATNQKRLSKESSSEKQHQRISGV